jgi:hypothetical protein
MWSRDNLNGSRRWCCKNHRKQGEKKALDVVDHLSGGFVAGKSLEDAGSLDRRVSTPASCSANLRSQREIRKALDDS